MQIGTIIFQVGLFVVIAIGVYFFFKNRNSKPKETEAKLIRRTEQRNGPAVTYTFTFETKDGEKTFSTQEAHYAKLEEGRTGMLAYRRRTFIDFEMYDKHVR